MPDVDNRIERLEREMRRLRGWILVLSIALVTTFALGATQGAPDELTLRKLIIVDGDGKERIVADTTSEGAALFVHYDLDGKSRITAMTLPGGSAHLLHHDSNGKKRIEMNTLPGGYASLMHYDSDGKKRIAATRSACVVSSPQCLALTGIPIQRRFPTCFIKSTNVLVYPYT